MIMDWKQTGLPWAQLHAPRIEGDVGYDLAYAGDDSILVHTGETVMVPTGVAVALPHKTWASIYGRSSTFQRGLLVPPSVIDNGWRGELLVPVHNILRGEAVEITPRQRIAQLVLHPAITPQLKYVRELESSERGTNGFGSTGV